MIRENYKGRQLKAVKGKSYAKSRISVNGTDCGEWFGTQADVIEWAKRTIDDVDSRPFEGRWNECWYTPGTYELNEHGHVVAPGGICSCDYCEKRRIEPCANITAGGQCVCSHCMKPYLGETSTAASETDVTAPSREQATTKVAEMAAKLSDEALCLAWTGTEGKPATRELALVRGWIMDEFNRRLGDDLFDEWLMDVDDNGGVNPLAYFATKGN
ncbi:hypothetical protein ABZT06_08555 [Streptomyces sp. NPDC005483]|uniref:hypothetical protein n=1 Tax=Streptomyces sp. NPDC005483 TaxID=3154882 RepID=UPI0033A9B2A7